MVEPRRDPDPRTTAGLAALVVAAPDPGRVLAVYRAVCGGDPIEEAAAEGPERLRFRVRNADVVLLGAGAPTPSADAAGSSGGAPMPRPGIHHVELRTVDPEAALRRLEAEGIEAVLRDGAPWVAAGDANGVPVALTSPAEARPDQRARCAAAHLDHVAIRVRDLAAASARWEAIAGVRAVQMGIHPVSGGAFTAARLVLGDDQMIELISPVEGVASAVADRLRSHGEGAHTVAIPAADLDPTLEALRRAGVEPLWRDPHWFVHPKDAAGVMIQLTPRVAH